MAKIVPPINFGLVEDGELSLRSSIPKLINRLLPISTANGAQLLFPRETEIEEFDLGRCRGAFRNAVSLVVSGMSGVCL